MKKLKILVLDCNPIIHIGLKSIFKTQTYENQIIMSNDGAYAGFINRFNKKIYITSHCNKCIIKNNSINETFLFLLIN